MGSVNPVNKGLRIYIETEKEFYNSGSSIEGVVYVEADSDSHFNALYIRIQGQEWCQWLEGSSKNMGKYTGNIHFYTMEYQLQVYANETLQKGQYAYPFSIQLSQNIPGSFESTTYKAKIQYKLQVYLIDYSDAQNKLSLAIPLLIRQPFRQDIGPSEGNCLANPNTFGCFGHGEVYLNARFSQNVCFEGETITVDYSLDNTTGNRQVQKVILNLVQYTFVAANNGVSRTYKNIISTITVKTNILIGDKISDTYLLPIPFVKCQTAIGTLVANYYQIQVTASLGLFSSDNPQVNAPLFILKNQLHSNRATVYHPKFSADDCRTAKPKFFRAPNYMFHRNRNLSLINFKTQDVMSLDELQ